jgi:Branched-chain amino acid transport protein (AzlD)
VTAAWLTIAVLFFATAAFKSAGPIALGGRELSGAAAGVIRLVAPALLAALVVYETLTGDTGGVEPDARLAGLAVAAVGVLRRLPLIATVALAAAAAAAAHALA